MEEQLKTLVVDETRYETRLTPKYERRRSYAPIDPRASAAMIPGIVRAVHVSPGQAVKKGEPLLVVEAMKMENPLFAPVAGKVKAVHAAVGEMVPKGRVLVELE